MSSALSSLVSDVVASPLGDVIASVGEGVAAAQRALDEGSLAQTLAIYSEQGDTGLQMLREIGYQPTFYSLPETTGEVNVSLTLGNAAGQNGAATGLTNTRTATTVAQRQITGRSRVYVTPVDAGFANTYGFSAQVSAKIHFKIVPVPPPVGSEEFRLVPDLLGKRLSEAREQVETMGMNLLVKDSVSVTTGEDFYQVIKADPPSGSLARVGDTVSVYVMR